MLFSSKIAELTKQLGVITAERDALLLSAASVEELTQANADCETRHNADQASMAALTANIATLTAQVADAAAAKVTADAAIGTAAATLETRVSAEVITRLAHAGVDPILRAPGAPLDPNAQKQGTPRSRLAASINAKMAAR
jgi:hypothetical protein